LVAKRQAPFALVQRARIVLLACAGLGMSEIAAEVGWSPRTVRKWKARFRDKPTVEGLDDLPRSGRKAEIPLWVRCELVSLACHRPERMKTPFRDIWTRESLATALERRTGFRLSVSEIGRILHNKELRPHRVRQWLKCTDPNFRKRARRVCDIYLNPPADTVVLCVDEKPMQALERLSPTHLNVKDASLRYEYEYKRHGVQVLLAAFDIRSGDVVAEVVAHRTGAALVDFMDKVADAYPNQKVTVIWDNLNIHTDTRLHCSRGLVILRREDVT
jgi:transposase